MNIKIDLINDWINLIKDKINKMGYSLDDINDPEKIGILFFNLQKRLIQRINRSVLLSDIFSCPSELQNGLDLIIKKIESGNDLRPHLSRSLKKFVYNDGLLNDWGIYHLHLGTNIDSDGFINRDKSDPKNNFLLYARFDDKYAYFINIMEHGKWTYQEMIKTIHKNWPESIKIFRSDGYAEMLFKPSDNDIKNLRNNNINTSVEVEKGISYLGIGGGLSSSGISSIAVINFDRYYNYFSELEKNVKENYHVFADKINNIKGSLPEYMEFNLEIDYRDIYLFEVNSNIRFKIGTV